MKHLKKTTTVLAAAILILSLAGSAKAIVSFSSTSGGCLAPTFAAFIFVEEFGAEGLLGSELNSSEKTCLKQCKTLVKTCQKVAKDGLKCFSNLTKGVSSIIKANCASADDPTECKLGIKEGNAIAKEELATNLAEAAVFCDDHASECSSLCLPD